MKLIPQLVYRQYEEKNDMIKQKNYRMKIEQDKCIREIINSTISEKNGLIRQHAVHSYVSHRANVLASITIHHTC